MANTKSKSTGNTSSKTNPFAKFADMSNMNQFMNPTQYFAKFSSGLPNFQAANVQQLMGQLIETSQKNIEAVTACTQIAIERAKDLMEEQASFTSRMLQETASTVQETISSNADAKSKLGGMTDYTKYYLEKTATHARKAAEDNLQTAQKISSTLSKRVSESMQEIRDAA